MPLQDFLNEQKNKSHQYEDPDPLGYEKWLFEQERKIQYTPTNERDQPWVKDILYLLKRYRIPKFFKCVGCGGTYGNDQSSKEIHEESDAYRGLCPTCKRLSKEGDIEVMAYHNNSSKENI